MKRCAFSFAAGLFPFMINHRPTHGFGMSAIEGIIAPVLALPRIAKKLIAVVLDIAFCFFTVWFAFYLRLGEWLPLSVQPWKAAVASPMIAIPIFVVFGLYREVFRYVSLEALGSIVRAVAIYGVIYASIFTAYVIEGTPRTVGIIQPILLLVAIALSRAFGRYLLGGHYRQLRRRANRRQVIIYGAGSSGRQLAAALADSVDTRIVGFVDNDRSLHGSLVAGIRVYDPDHLEALIDRYGVEEILLAIPSATRRRRNEILEVIRETGVAVRTLPGLLDLAHGKVTVNTLRPLEIDDLLGRDPVPPKHELIERNIENRTVLVTGAGGSIGGELCRQILLARPARMLLVETSEFALYSIHRELTKLAQFEHETLEIVPLLASVCDRPRMARIFAAWRPETIYHAAAYKHVPLVEHNLAEGVRNNVVGTLTCATLARDHDAASFVLISTDKAVRPTNVMGASKRLSELVLQALAADGAKTVFTMVRFGNVLGSSGSVVPLFRSQIAAGGPVTVTHREVIRYFMTIPEAAQLVLQAGGMARGGEVFVLDMGDPVRVTDLAIRMIELSGLRVRDDHNPGGDIEIEFSGLRPGEKLYEELLIGENPTATTHPRIMTASEHHIPMKELLPRLDALRKALDGQDARRVRDLVSALVPEYVPDKLVDNVLLRGEQAGMPDVPHPNAAEL